MDLFTTACLVAVLVAWKIAGRLLRRHFFRKLTVVDDLHNLGLPRAPHQRLRGTAVICGGSISGLWAARVCADHFDDVLVVEAERWLETEEGVMPNFDEKGNAYNQEGKHERTRVMQADAVHVYQNINTTALIKAFPEAEAEMARRDVRTQNTPYMLYLSSGKVPPPSFKQTPRGVNGTILSASRDTYEKLLRYLVRKIPNVRWMSGTVTGLRCKEGCASTVEGVMVRIPDTKEPGNGDTFIPASLVIDCSGRAQVGLKWIKRIHSSLSTSSPTSKPTPPPYLKYDVNGQYNMFHFNIAPKLRERLDAIIPGGYNDAGWLLSYVPEPGLEKRIMVATKTEGHMIKIITIGYGESYLPQKPDEFDTFLRSLVCKDPFPNWYHELVNVLTEDDTYVCNKVKMPPCSWVQYEKATHIPDNFIATGDATMCANPAWGQGCSKAIIGAVTLDSVLRTVQRSKDEQSEASIPKNFSKKFFTLHGGRIEGVWDGAKPVDYGFPDTIPTPGETLKQHSIQRSFSRLIIKLAMKHMWVTDRLWKVKLFLAPPTDLLHPFILVTAAWELFKEYIGIA